MAETRVVLYEKRGQETNLGDFIADSFVDWVRPLLRKILLKVNCMIIEQYASRSHSEDQWTDLSLAFLNTGGIRGSFSMGNITQADLFTVMPFGNSIDRFKMKGKYLKTIFEFVAGRMKSEGENNAGGFLQVSGENIFLFQILILRHKNWREI